jgi:hypothetical protein
MRADLRKLVLLPCLLLFSGSGVAGFSGYVAVEAVTFADEAQFEGQFDENVTLSFKPKWQGEWNDGDDLWSVELFARADNKDSGRNHADIRELLWLKIDGDNEWRVGINTMFWGVTESQHLVDVVNQIDAVESIDFEEKLGQPMIHLKRYEDWGVLDFLVLPGFRERTFHAEEGRLRRPLVVDGDQTEYESSAGQRHVDYALRYSHTLGDLDFGISGFKGTNRDPLFSVGSNDSGESVFTPFYEQMIQLGVDAQLLYYDWIWRLEYIHRESNSADRNAWVAGFEYTFFGVFDSSADIGAIVEYNYDDRPEELRGVFDRDVFVGARLALNDAQSSELLTGFLVDVEKGSRNFRVEASRRVGESWKATLEIQAFSNVAADDPLSALANDSYLLFDMAYYF